LTLLRDIKDTNMISRSRLKCTLNHEEPDRVCVDFGSTGQSGIAASVVYRLRKKLINEDGYRVKISEPYQMLGEVDDKLREVLGLDVVGLLPPESMFGFENTGWKPFEMFDGTPVLVPEGFNVTKAQNGDLLMHPQGDITSPPSARMPKGGCFFDSIVRQEPIVEEKLDPWDNIVSDFGLLSDEVVKFYAENIKRLTTETNCGVMLTLPGTSFGDIAAVPAPWVKNPKGIRDVEEWYVSTVIRRDYVYKIFEEQSKIMLQNLNRIIDTVEIDNVDVINISGTDFGTQRGLFISPQTYRDLYKPFQKKINDLIHRRTNWKIFIHSCGAIFDLMPDLIEAGFDVFNPVQCSAAGMNPQKLKNEYGDQVVFWGGGVDTQKTLPFGTPQEVYREVSERIKIFSKGGGFVFNTIHNIQSNTPLENVLAMFKAIRDSAKIRKEKRIRIRSIKSTPKISETLSKT